MTAPPLAFSWDGEVMRPLRPATADKHYVIGMIYLLEEAPEERSVAQHRHYFATLREMWMNLPESLADLYPTVNHLRKHALIEAGYFRETIIDAGSHAAALRVAAYAKGEDEFAAVVTRGVAVVVRKAKSQRMRGADRMSKQEFRESSNAVLEIVAALIGVKGGTENEHDSLAPHEARLATVPGHSPTRHP